MIEVRESPMSELTDTDLDAVCGGFLNGIGNVVTQTNTGVQVGVAVSLGGLAQVAQALGQLNFSI